MNVRLITSFGFAVLRLSTPLVFAALSAAICEKAGLFNMAAESMMLWGALIGVIVSGATHSALIGFLAAMAAGAVTGMLIWVATVKGKADLMLAQIEYDKGESRDTMVIAGYLSNIDETYVEQKATEEFKQMYELMMSSVGGTVGGQYYEAGNEAFRIMDYSSAIENYKKAVLFDSENSDALFALADAYRQNGDKAKAKETYTLVTERFPETENASRALGFIAELGE